MGDLYVGQHLRLDRPVALKLLSADFKSSEIARARFEREARVTARIDSPFVVDVLDVFEADGRPCLVAELLEGEDLQRCLQKRKRLELREVLTLAVQLGRGLAAAHRAHIVHRDIKPSNVFLTDRGAKLIDFGVAALSEGDADNPITRTGAVLGTPAYMAPEQVGNARHADARSDVYGVGAILYRALSGKPPYRGAPTQVLGAILDGPPEPLEERCPELPFAVVDLVQHAMERNPTDRFASGDELADAAEALLARKNLPEASTLQGVAARAGAGLLVAGLTAQAAPEIPTLGLAAAGIAPLLMLGRIHPWVIWRGVLSGAAIAGAALLCLPMTAWVPPAWSIPALAACGGGFTALSFALRHRALASLQSLEDRGATSPKRERERLEPQGPVDVGQLTGHPS